MLSLLHFFVVSGSLFTCQKILLSTRVPFLSKQRRSSGKGLILHREDGFTWLAAQNRLATGDRKLHWNIDADAGCILCGVDVESRDHLFFSCSYSSQVWSALTCEIMQNEFTTSWNCLLQILSNTNCPKLPMFVLRYTFQTTLHSLWRETEKETAAGMESHRHLHHN